MKEIDIWRAARQLIDLYDVDAGWQAGLRADHLYNEGDMDGFHAWARIARVIRELQGIGNDEKDMRN